MKYTTVFIDLDDTLIDTVSNTIETLQEVYNDYELEQYFGAFETFKTVFQTNNINNWHLYEQNLITKEALIRNRFLVPFASVEGVSDEQALEINEDYIGRIVSKDKLIDGAKDLLDYLRLKYQICAISNGFTEMQFRKIESAGLSKYFDKVILSDSVGVNKPHPDIFTYALQMTGASKPEAIMIGDNYATDIIGARNSSIDQIWYNPHSKSAEDIDPTYVVTKLIQIKKIL